jgi:predicted enzyme related to lactoylglutathione lyase
MITHLAAVTVYVDDQDRALDFYTGILGFERRRDVRIPGGMRWLTVAPKGQAYPEVVLEHVNDSDRAQNLPKAVGGGTTWVLHTDDCQATYRELKAKGVEFSRSPETRAYGTEAVFVDLYGNPFALVELARR